MFKAHAERNMLRWRCETLHSSSLKKANWNAATKHVTFRVTDVTLVFPQVEKNSAIDAAALDWAEHYSLFLGKLVKDSLEISNWSVSSLGRLKQPPPPKNKKKPQQQTKKNDPDFYFQKILGMLDYWKHLRSANYTW